MRVSLLIIFNLLFICVRAQVTFIIESLPNTTPEEDTIFITGSFNNWNVNDRNYMLHPQLDGKYSVTLPADTGKIEFKFTRGSWQKVETNEKNAHTQNRIYTYGSKRDYTLKIKNWQDLGGVKRFNYMVLLLFAIAFYGVTLLLFALRIQIRNKSFIRSFFFLNSSLIIALIGAVFYNQANLIWQSHISLFGMVLLFIWGPTFVIFLQSLQLKKKLHYPLMHFIPALIAVILAVLSINNFELLAFFSKEINPDITWGNSLIIFLGIVANVIYHQKAFKLVKLKPARARKLPKDILLTNIIVAISTGSLLYLCVNYMILITGLSWGIAKNFEMVLILLSMIIFVEFYYYWKYPELWHRRSLKLTDLASEAFKNNRINYDNASRRNIDKVSQALPTELSMVLKSRILDQMTKSKAYKDPQLNIAKLSEIIDSKPHILSKLLNEQFHKSFRDFINEYRIKEFIELATSEEFKNYTLLALSYEVGFNSKSTFNLSFKKVTGFSPRNFLKRNCISLKE